MRRSTAQIIVIALLLLLPSPVAIRSARASAVGTGTDVRAESRQDVDNEQGTPLSRTVAVEGDTAVRLCLDSGDVIVRGWERQEVRASSSDVAQIRLQPVEAAAGGGAAAASAAKLTKRIEILLSNFEDETLKTGACRASGNLVVDVPRGATVTVEVRSGDVDVTDVAEARVESLSGDVDLSRISRTAEVKVMSGDISLKESSGRISLRSFSGDIDVTNIRPASDGDPLIVKATSGSIALGHVGHARVEASTVSGDVSLDGSLARGGSYDLKTNSGDVSVALPADASFKLNARVVSGDGEIITAFPVKTNPIQPPQPSKEYSAGRLVGTVGTGEAEIVLSSFSGTVVLKKR